MVNMKMKSKEDTVLAQEKPEYPYGLCLDLNDETMEALGITSLPKTGQIIMIRARTEVRSTNEHKDGDEVKRSISLQITDMEIGGKTDDRQAHEKIYGPMEDKSNRMLVEDF